MRRTTINIDDALYKELVSESIEKYGSMRKLSELINELLKKRGMAAAGMVAMKKEKGTERHLAPAGASLSANMPKTAHRGKIEKYINDELGRKGGLLFAVIDPVDYPSLGDAVKTAKNADEAGADAILIGGSTGVHGEMLDVVTKSIKESVSAPVILFPGNIGAVTKHADAVYFMSLLNSRNAYWISGAQMLAAPMVRKYGVEPLPTGYIVVEPGGTVGYVGDANIVPRTRPKIAAAMALSAQYMGFRIIITDAGSNPKEGHIPLDMVAAVSKTIDVPYVVAGGIRTKEEARNVIAAGADIIQVGTAFEKQGSIEKIREMVASVREGAKAGR